MRPFTPRLRLRVSSLACLLLAILPLSMLPAHAASPRAINREVDKALANFQQFDGTQAYLDVAKGMLVFPKVYKAGFGIGGEYGEGALRVEGKTVAYYSTATASVGFQLGAQAKALVILFTSEDALRTFRAREAWKVGVDGSVALVEPGADKAVDTARIRDPMVGFVFGPQGLMQKRTLDGTTFTRLDK